MDLFAFSRIFNWSWLWNLRISHLSRIFCIFREFFAYFNDLLAFRRGFQHFYSEFHWASHQNLTIIVFQFLTQIIKFKTESIPRWHMATPHFSEWFYLNWTTDSIENKILPYGNAGQTRIKHTFIHTITLYSSQLILAHHLFKWRFLVQNLHLLALVVPG